jgi:S1-C subfamily serine protease
VRRAFIGVSADTVTLPRRTALLAGRQGDTAVRLRAVEKDGPADRAGLRPGDVILSIDGVAIGGVDDLIRLLHGDRIARATDFSVLSPRGLETRSIVPSARHG